MTPEELMARAIAKAREGIAAGQTPFGCAIAFGDELLAVSHNLVYLTTDITAHAEIVAIRQACHQARRIHLTDCLVASTCEPCPMCMSALHWARVDQVYYGASIADATLAGFNELKVAASDLLRLGESHVRLTSGVMAVECQQLFDEWKRTPRHDAY